MNKFKHKYRIPSARLQTWDYGANGLYFITICTQNRECYFGDIVETRFIASQIGELVRKYWYEIPEHFPYVKLDTFVVMPNHVHGIIVIDKPYGDAIGDDGCNGRSQLEPQPLTNKTGGITGNKNPMIHENISRIIRWYKAKCSFNARKIHADFAWQTRFHDHIIRDEKSFITIQTYINESPMKWVDDKFYNME